MSGTHAIQSTVVIVSLALLSASSASAKCPPEWLYGPDQGLTGTDWYVYATTRWDPDGPGPQPELLVVAGAFFVAGDAVASKIAAWNGSAWHALGSGTNGTVRALTVYDGALIAAGGENRLTTGILLWIAGEHERVSGAPISGPEGGSPSLKGGRSGNILAPESIRSVKIPLVQFRSGGVSWKLVTCQQCRGGAPARRPCCAPAQF